MAQVARFLARREEGVGWCPATDEGRRAKRPSERETKRNRTNIFESHTSHPGATYMLETKQARELTQKVLSLSKADEISVSLRRHCVLLL